MDLDGLGWTWMDQKLLRVDQRAIVAAVAKLASACTSIGRLPDGPIAGTSTLQYYVPNGFILSG